MGKIALLNIEGVLPFHEILDNVSYIDDVSRLDDNTDISAIIYGSSITIDKLKLLKLNRNTAFIPLICIVADTLKEFSINILPDFKLNIADIKANNSILLDVVNKANKLYIYRKNKSIKYIVSFWIHSSLNMLDIAQDFIGKLLISMNIDSEKIEEILTATYELGVNAIEWGNGGDESKHVKMHFMFINGKVEFRIEDEGSGFDYKRYLSSHYKPVMEQDNRINYGKRYGGFGIKISKNLVDKISYMGRGNIVCIEKVVNA